MPLGNCLAARGNNGALLQTTTVRCCIELDPKGRPSGTALLLVVTPLRLGVAALLLVAGMVTLRLIILQPSCAALLLGVTARLAIPLLGVAVLLLTVAIPLPAGALVGPLRWCVTIPRPASRMCPYPRIEVVDHCLPDEKKGLPKVLFPQRFRVLQVTR